MSVPEIRPGSRAAQGESQPPGEAGRVDRKVFGIGLGIVLAVIVYVLMPDEVPTTLQGGETEYTAHGLAVAAAVACLPIMGGVATGIGQDVMLLVIPVALAATCAFMLPVATPPNAIAFGSGYVRIGDMVKGGIWLNIIGMVLITATVMVMGPLVLGIGQS